MNFFLSLEYNRNKKSILWLFSRFLKAAMAQRGRGKGRRRERHTILGEDVRYIIMCGARMCRTLCKQLTTDNEDKSDYSSVPCADDGRGRECRRREDFGQDYRRE